MALGNIKNTFSSRAQNVTPISKYKFIGFAVHAEIETVVWGLKIKDVMKNKNKKTIQCHVSFFMPMQHKYLSERRKLSLSLCYITYH